MNADSDFSGAAGLVAWSHQLLQLVLGVEKSEGGGGGGEAESECQGFRVRGPLEEENEKNKVSNC